MVGRTLALIESGNVGSEMLTVTRSLSKPVGEYKTIVAHRSAAVQLLTEGRDVDVGDGVRFVYLDSEHPNPLCRVRLPDSVNRRYDKEMYAGLAIETARTVFSGMAPFFSTLYQPRFLETKIPDIRSKLPAEGLLVGIANLCKCPTSETSKTGVFVGPNPGLPTSPDYLSGRNRIGSARDGSRD